MLVDFHAGNRGSKPLGEADYNKAAIKQMITAFVYCNRASHDLLMLMNINSERGA